MLRAFVLFEFGSTSLKCYHRFSDREPIRTHKIRWKLGHEVYQSGFFSGESIWKAVEELYRLLVCFGDFCDPGQTIAFATGVFREARNASEFFCEVRNRLGLKVRLISGDQEAALLKSLYLSRADPDFPFAFDLGGGSLQWVAVGPGQCSDRGSIPIGAIQLFRVGTTEAGKFHCDIGFRVAGKHLSAMPIVQTGKIAGTGGTVKAICRTLNTRVVTLGDIKNLRERVQAEGPPTSLQPHRRPIFLPGIVLVEQLMQQLGAETLRYQNLSVGEALLEKVLPFYDEDSAQRSPSGIFRQIQFSGVIPAGSSAGGVG